VSFLKNTIRIMNNEKLVLELKDIVKPYVQSLEALENISEETDFIKDLKINSANLVDVILDVESKYDIVIDDESMEKMLTVKAAMDIINDKVSKK